MDKLFHSPKRALQQICRAKYKYKNNYLYLYLCSIPVPAKIGCHDSIALRSDNERLQDWRFCPRRVCNGQQSIKRNIFCSAKQAAIYKWLSCFLLRCSGDHMRGKMITGSCHSTIEHVDSSRCSSDRRSVSRNKLYCFICDEWQEKHVKSAFGPAFHCKLG